MGNSNNVVNLHTTPRTDTPSTSSIAGLPELITSAQRIAQRHLETNISTLFNNADDCLFEYADKALNNQQQSLYFAAMRELRIQKEHIQENFRNNFEQRYIKSYRDPGQTESDSTQDTGMPSTLSLVEEDVLEKSLAVTQMSQRIYTECREELSALVIRFNEIAKQQKFTRETLPLSPDIICAGFQDATECLTSELEIKLIVFKLFDKFVRQNINSLYKEVNQTFVAAGVLPTIKYSVPVAQQHRVTQAPGTTVATHNVQGTTPLNSGAIMNGSVPTSHALSQSNTTFESISQALHQYRHADTLSGNTGNATPVYTDTSNPDTASYLVTHDIIESLSQLQGNADFTGVESVLGTQTGGSVIKSGILNNIKPAQGDQGTLDMRRSDADVIDIVSMMFDYILNDKHLADRIRLSIGRLQIPIVKVAMLDKSFFARKNHPARELLNELALSNATLSAYSEDNDALFAKIDYVVESILSHFTREIQIFEDLLIEFREFLASLLKTEQLAKEMLLQARETVAAELQQRTRDKNMPPELSQFIMGPWKEVLKFVAVRDNCDGESWYLFTSLIDDLLWSIQPKYTAADRKLLTQRIPDMLRVIHEGIRQIGQYHDEALAFTKTLEKLHLHALRTSLDTTEDAYGEWMEFDLDLDDLTASEYELCDNTANTDVITEIEIGGEQPAKVQYYQANADLRKSRYYQYVTDMPLGTWITFINAAGECNGKLTWKCAFTGDYVFMNRTHKVAADLNLRELVLKLEDGSAKVVSHVPLLDRAIDSVVKGLSNCIDAWKGDSATLH